MKEIESLRKKYDYPKLKPNIEKHVKGWQRAENVAYLRMVLSDKTKVILELGTFLGQNVLFMEKVAPNATIIAIDNFKGETLR